MEQERDARWHRLHNEFIAYRCGCEQAVDVIFLELEKILKAYFHRRLFNENEVKDMCQTTLLKIHMSRHNFNDNLSFKTWVFTIAHRVCVDFFRKTKRHSQFIERLAKTSFEDLEVDNDDTDLLHEQATLLEDAIKRLKPVDQSLLSQQIHDELPLSVIAGRVGMTEGAVKVRLHRAIKSLRSLLPILFIFIRWVGK